MIMAIVVDYYCYISLVDQLQVIVITIALGVIITITMVVITTIVVIQIIIIIIVAITDITQTVKVITIIVIIQVEHHHLNLNQADQSLVFAVVFPSTPAITLVTTLLLFVAAVSRTTTLVKSMHVEQLSLHLHHHSINQLSYCYSTTAIIQTTSVHYCYYFPKDSTLPQAYRNSRN